MRKTNSQDSIHHEGHEVHEGKIFTAKGLIEHRFYFVHFVKGPSLKRLERLEGAQH